MKEIRTARLYRYLMDGWFHDKRERFKTQQCVFVAMDLLVKPALKIYCIAPEMICRSHFRIDSKLNMAQKTGCTFAVSAFASFLFYRAAASNYFHYPFTCHSFFLIILPNKCLKEMTKIPILEFEVTSLNISLYPTSPKS